jgi:hypothetical protein
MQLGIHAYDQGYPSEEPHAYSDLETRRFTAVNFEPLQSLNVVINTGRLRREFCSDT